MAAAVQGGVDVALQPIVDLESGEVVSVEALARFSDGRSPDKWFAEAEKLGLGTALELAAIEAALARMSELPDSASLNVNVSAATACSGALGGMLAKVPGRRVVLEITEHDVVGDYDVLATALAGLRARGVRLAVDDAGAGFASMQHVLELKPDVVKLDASLVRNMDSVPERKALVSALVSFANATGCSLIAEGVETAGELETLRELGVSCGQGFHLGRPDAAGPARWQVDLPRKPRRPAASYVRGARRFVKPAAMFVAAAMSWQGIVAVAGVEGPRVGAGAVQSPAAAAPDSGASGVRETAEPAAASIPPAKSQAARKVEVNERISQPSPSRAAPLPADPVQPVKEVVETVTDVTTGLTQTVTGLTETVTNTLGGLLRGVLGG
ncbi:MAG: EAL domain-containing protein [Actinomycetota bacterium]